MKCPTCTTPDLLMSERLGIEIDYCPQCRGVWLDRGELDKIIERSTHDVPQASPAPAPMQVPMQHMPHSAPAYYNSHGDHHDKHYDKHGGYRKKSIWQELFD